MDHTRHWSTTSNLGIPIPREHVTMEVEQGDNGQNILGLFVVTQWSV